MSSGFGKKALQSITNIAERKLRVVNKQRWRRAITAVLSINALLKNAGFPGLAETGEDEGMF